MLYIKGITRLLDQPVGFVYLDSDELLNRVKAMVVKSPLKKQNRVNEKAVEEKEFMDSTGISFPQLCMLTREGFIIRVYKQSKAYILKNQYLEMLLRYLRETGAQVKEFRYQKLQYCKQKV